MIKLEKDIHQIKSGSFSPLAKQSRQTKPDKGESYDTQVICVWYCVGVTICELHTSHGD
jgi:hypothetical protein